MPRKPRERHPCRLCGEPALAGRTYCSHECLTRARLGMQTRRAVVRAALVREGKLIEQALTKLERKTTDTDMEDNNDRDRHK